jgi:hypothetical protein
MLLLNRPLHHPVIILLVIIINADIHIIRINLLLLRGMYVTSMLA